MINEKTDEIHNKCPADHFEMNCEFCKYKIIPKKVALKHFPGRLPVSFASFVSSSCMLSPSSCQSQTVGAGGGCQTNTAVACAPTTLPPAHSRSCWRVKKAIRLVVCCHDRPVGEKNARDRIRRANQHARWLGTPGKSAKSFEARQGRRQNATPTPCTAAHSKAPPLTPAHCTLHTAQRTTPSTANLRLLHGPGSAAYPYCTPHYCCKPPLL